MSLTPRMLLLTILVGVILWAALDQVQSRRLRHIFEANLSQRLQKHVHEDRMRFDNYVGIYSQAAKLIVSQHSFHNYVRIRLRPGKPAGIAFHSNLPGWLPDAAIMRKFPYITYALLIDQKGVVKEVYQSKPGPPPASLLNSSELVRQLSHNQSFMTSIDGNPFLLASESLPGPNGAPAATLMLAAGLDDEFLLNSQRGSGFEGEITALTGGREPRVVASSRADILPVNTKVADLENEYLITGKSFFDSGASDLMLHLTTMMSKREFRKLNEAILNAERLQRAIVSLALIAAFVLIMYSITRRIRRFTHTISDVSQSRLDMRRSYPDAGGDEIRVLEGQFRQFTEEILESRNLLKKQAEELLREKTVYLDNILHSSAMAIIAADTALRIKYYNSAAEHLLENTATDVIGKILGEIDAFKFIGPDSMEKAVKVAGQSGAFHDIVQQKSGAGINRFLDFRLTTILDSEKALIGHLLIFQDITGRKQAEEERERLLRDKLDALTRIKVLSGLLPICASCKKIRDDKGYWSQLEHYIAEHSDAEFSHGICPDCMTRLYPLYARESQKKPDGGETP